MVDVPLSIVAIATAIVAGWAGLSKLYRFRPFATSARAVLPGWLSAGVAAGMVVGAELFVPIGLTAGLGSAVGVAVLVLGSAFAVAGGIALVRRIHVECRCFGSPSNHELGWRQIAFFPVWVLAAYAAMSIPAAPFAQRLQVAAASAVIVVCVQAFRCGRLYWDVRADRRAFAGG